MSGSPRLLRLFTCVLALALPFAAAARDWRPLVSPYGELFPSLAIATAALRDTGARDEPGVLGDRHGLVGASVVAARDGEPVRLTVQIPGLAEPSTLDVRLPHAGERYTLFPRMRWDAARLASWRDDSPARAGFLLETDSGNEERSLEVRVRSVNQAPYHVGGKPPSDLNWMFAAYVNEQHPLVEQIVREARRGGIVRRFDGYDSGSAEDVYRQVFALWRVLQSHGIRYSPIARVSSVNDRVLSQYVRFLDESWESSEANCVDGSVLMASLLRRVGLRPSLVLVPGHMFIAFDLDRDGRRRGYLETTRLGGTPGAARAQPVAGIGARDDDSLHGLAGELAALDEDASFATFERAVEEGVARYSRARNRFFDEARPQYQIIDIEAARRLGVAAIGFEPANASAGSTAIAAPSGR